MNNPELSRQLQKLNNLIKKSADVAANDGDIEMQSHWAKYLCVLAAGFLENSIYEIYTYYVQSRASPEVVSYARRSLSQIHNPKTYKFIETARLFRDSWANELEQFIDEDGRKYAINSIMGNRHQIAHGKDSNITITSLKDWLDKSIEVVEFIEDQVS